MYKFYESDNQGYCPRCGKEITNWCDTMIDENKLDLYFVCDCGLHGCETYELKHIYTRGEGLANTEQ